MKKLLVITFLFLFFVSSAAGQNWYKGSFDNALETAKSEGKQVLIDFFSDG